MRTEIKPVEVIVKHGWEDRAIAILGLTCFIGITATITALVFHDVGYDEGKAVAKAACVPKVIRQEYSTEELARILRARKRMEAVK